MNLYSAFKTNTDLVNDGVWYAVAYDENEQPIEFKIAHMGQSNTEYTKALGEMVSGPSVTDAMSRAMMRKIFCKHLIKDWRNVQNEAGEPLQYSPDVAYGLMNDLPELYQALFVFAKDLDNYLESKVEAAVKNS